jgi:hypothetical protein
MHLAPAARVLVAASAALLALVVKERIGHT